jgi:hypothetical protein
MVVWEPSASRPFEPLKMDVLEFPRTSGYQGEGLWNLAPMVPNPTPEGSISKESVEHPEDLVWSSQTRIAGTDPEGLSTNCPLIANYTCVRLSSK